MSTAERAEILHNTVELYPLPAVWRDIEDKIDEAEGYEDQAFQEELDRIFGPDNTQGAEQIDNLLRWMMDLEQSAENEEALAEPFLEEARRHQRRASSLKGRVAWIRRRLAYIVKAHGGRFSGIRKVSVRPGNPRVVVAGYCKNQAHAPELDPEEAIGESQGPHWEREDCMGFSPAVGISGDYLKITVEVKRQEIAKAHRALKEQGRDVDMRRDEMRALLSLTRMQPGELTAFIR